MSEKSIDANFDEESGTFLLQLRPDDVGLANEAVEFQGKRFQPKDEVHITIIGTDLGERLKAAMERDPTIEPQLRQQIDETDWSYQLQDRWYHVVQEAEDDDEDGREESIIRMAGVAGVADFYERLSQMLAVELEVPPTHVTLYTYNNAHGIGVANQAEFDELVTRAVSAADLLQTPH